MQVYRDYRLICKRVYSPIDLEISRWISTIVRKRTVHVYTGRLRKSAVINKYLTTESYRNLHATSIFRVLCRLSDAITIYRLFDLFARSTTIHGLLCYIPRRGNILRWLFIIYLYRFTINSVSIVRRFPRARAYQPCMCTHRKKIGVRREGTPRTPPPVSTYCPWGEEEGGYNNWIAVVGRKILSVQYENSHRCSRESLRPDSEDIPSVNNPRSVALILYITYPQTWVPSKIFQTYTKGNYRPSFRREIVREVSLEKKQ